MAYRRAILFVPILVAQGVTQDPARALGDASAAEKEHAYARAFHAYEQAFSAKPALLEDLGSPQWYEASCCVVLACTLVNPGKRLKGEERDRALEKALSWLGKGLAMWEHNISEGASPARATKNALSGWQKDPRLAYVRDPQRTAWKPFWTKIEEVIQKAAKKVKVDGAIVDKLYAEGEALSKKNDLDGAIQKYRKGIEVDPRNAMLYTMVGLTLVYKHDRDTAMLWFQRALQIDPRFAPAYCNIGLVYSLRSNTTAAMRATRKAVELDPTLPTPHYNLGFTLLDLGRYEEALVHLREAVELCKEDSPNLDYYKKMVRLAESELPKQKRLLRIADGKLDPRDATEVILAANAAYGSQRFGAALKTYDRGFVLDRSLLDDMVNQHRYNAACCAALVATGQGKDARKLSASVRATLRRRALAWLQEDLEYWKKQADGDKKALGDACYTLTHMQGDSDFDGMRGAALQALPEKERAAWQAWWTDLDKTLHLVYDKMRTE